jgi:hypothetical protein
LKRNIVCQPPCFWNELAAIWKNCGPWAKHCGNREPVGCGDPTAGELAEKTDSNPETRVASLLSERERLDRQIEEIRSGRVAALPDSQALERIREITALADGLASDFRRVRDDFERLNRELRERLLDEESTTPVWM